MKMRGVVTGLLIALFCLAFVSSVPLYAQLASGRISGVVTDPSGAVIPNAQVTLTREGTGDVRRSTTNAEGVYSFMGLPAADYNLEVTATNFNKYLQKKIALTIDQRAAIDVQLTPGGVTTTVEVSADTISVPVDSIEKSSLVSSNQISNTSILGRNAVEMVKILPGVVIDPGNAFFSEGRSSFGYGGFNVVGLRGDVGGAISDGGDVTDTGNNQGATVSPNADMVQEIKVQTAAMSADNAHGPLVISAVTKSGTNQFHGTGYFYARNSALNAAGWQNNYLPNIAHPVDHYYYPGFNIGGPVLIPGTNFNKNRDKLFFFYGIEYNVQQVDLGTNSKLASVPTEKMKAGDFSEILNGTWKSTTGNTQGAPTNAVGGVQFFDPTTYKITNSSLIDPGGLALMKAIPNPNLPYTANGENFISHKTVPQNRIQNTARIDYSFSDNTKLYSRLNIESDIAHSPYAIWWQPDRSVPNASESLNHAKSYSVANSLVHVFNPSTTNEFVFTYSFFNNPIEYADPQAMSRTKAGYPYKTLFNSSDLLPYMQDPWNMGFTLWNFGGLPIYSKKYHLTFANNFSKVKGTHTLKFGGSFDYTGGPQSNNPNTSGVLDENIWTGVSTGNAFADLLIGQTSSWSEATAAYIAKMWQKEWAIYGQDSWKASRKLTLEYGIRLIHMGQMYDKSGNIAVFNPAAYNVNKPNSGIETKSLGSGVPASGFETNPLLFAPRVGFAYDISGKGSTVIRGGYGIFQYRDSGNVFYGATGNPPIMKASSIGFPIKDAAGNVVLYGRFKELANIDPTKYVVKSDLTTIAKGDKSIPTTYSWNFTISQRLPKSIIFEASYVGNVAQHLVGQTNINSVPQGAMYGQIYGNDANNYRPYKLYGGLRVNGHNEASNYHSAQFTVNRQVGRFNFAGAYTWSKSMGMNGPDNPHNLWDAHNRNYGPLGYDCTHVLSIAYNFLMPDLTKVGVLKPVLNGWQLSGISSFQAGRNLAGLNGGITANGQMAVAMDPKDPATNGIGSTNVYGTPDMPGMKPYNLTCDPSKGLTKDSQGRPRYANINCYVAPLPRQNTVFNAPYLRGPGWQNHDLSVFKNFKLSEDGVRNVQVRISGYNFLNHTNWVIPGSGLEQTVTFDNGVRRANDAFGVATQKNGRRILQFAIKFMF